ncbi:hypothetical protein KA043_01815 [Candidatus Saccharibacteria bacterium]|nr:hypothetical protein [Candidatus Saccharibacteria bacterium]
MSILVLSVVFNLSLALLAFLSSRGQNYIKFFMAFVVSVCLWLISSYMLEATTNINTSNALNSFAYGVSFLVFYFAMLFTLNFTDSNVLSSSKKVLIVILGLFGFIFSISSLVAGQVVQTDSGKQYEPGSFISIYILILLINLAICIFNLVKNSKKQDKVKKRQAQLLIFGFSLGAFIGLLTNIIIPMFLDSWGSSDWAPFATVIMVAFTSIAIIKYGLFDVRLVVARLFGYMLTLGTIIAFFIAFTIFLSNSVLSVEISFFSELLFALITVFIAISFSKIKKFFDKLTNSIFYQDTYDPQVVLNELNAALVSSSYIDEILSLANKVLGNHIKPVFNGIIVDSGGSDFKHIFTSNNFKLTNEVNEKIANSIIGLPNKTFVTEQLGSDQKQVKKLLQANQIAIVTKLMTKKEFVGMIILGERKSGNGYHYQDIQLIETASDSISIAAQNALRYEEIKTFNLTLEHKINTATHQLQKSNEKLKALDEAKDEFISMASHQLRTPLTSVKGYVSMVLEEDAGPINDQQRKFLNQAFISSQRMVYLISDLLNVSRLKTGKFVIENKPAYLPDTVEQEIAQLEETVKARELTMKYNKPESFPTVGIDEEKIRQVIMNFADNAIYYTPAGGVINIELKATKDSIEYTVKDDGIGVPRSEQPHLFTKFYRAGNARKARPDGTGLGLFMAKKVITAQGGAIIFHSTEGKGSTFGFTLPRKKVEITNK